MKQEMKIASEEILGDEIFEDKILDRLMPGFIGIMGVGLIFSYMQVISDYYFGVYLISSLSGLGVYMFIGNKKDANK